MSKVFEIAVEGKKEKEKLIAQDEVQAQAIANVLRRIRDVDEKKANKKK